MNVYLFAFVVIYSWFNITFFIYTINFADYHFTLKWWAYLLVAPAELIFYIRAKLYEVKVFK